MTALLPGPAKRTCHTRLADGKWGRPVLQQSQGGAVCGRNVSRKGAKAQKIGRRLSPGAPGMVIKSAGRGRYSYFSAKSRLSRAARSEGIQAATRIMTIAAMALRATNPMCSEKLTAWPITALEQRLVI